MKILFFISNLGGGGAERVLITICSELVKRCHDITLAVNKKIKVFPTGPDIKIFYATSQNSASSGNCIFRPIKQLVNYLHYFRTTRAIIRDVQPDIIVSFLQCNLMQILLFHGKAPVVSSERNAFDRNLGVANFVNRFILNRFVKVVTVLTPFDKGYAVAKGLYNTVIMPNPLPWAIMDKGEYCNDFESRNNILACGRVDQWKVKGFDLLIKAFSIVSKKYPSWSLDIAGKGSKNNMALLKKMALSNGLNDNQFRLLGFSDNVRTLMSRYSFLVLSSRTEGFPNVVIESMSVGTPVISYERLVNSIVLDSIDGLLVEDESIAGLAAAMETMIENQELRYEIGLNALNDVSRFSTERIVDKWESLFRRIKDLRE